MKPSRAVSRVALLVILAAAVMATSALVATRLAERRALALQADEGYNQLQLQALALERLIDSYRVLPTVLALDPELRAALTGPVDAAATTRLNLKLEHANVATHPSTLTLVDRRGVAVAANNWREPGSNVGRHYDFRPYFQGAMDHGVGVFYAVGLTTRVPGYYMAEAVTDDDGARIGAVVVKISLDAVQGDELAGHGTVLVSDEHGIVFVATRPAWRYRALRPLDATTRRRLADTRQYAGEPLQTADVRVQRDLGVDGRVVTLGAPRQHGRYLWLTRDLPEQHWQLHLVQDAGPAFAAGRTAGAITALAWLPLILLGLYLQQRTRLVRLRIRSRDELERMVAHYTGALRSAQDSLVVAANQVVPGQDASLEHLPQGVSVVDANLCLVAWNARYTDIFRFPGELMQVGRPIADLFRYNARRGLLGPGDPEEAIERRLGFLRSGGPYAHERERPDGTVLEIRGNPLPGGGYVTSYADITTYKNAARDLRTLASTLEQRIEERTRDLAVAKAEAERANRYKTRFVAAAVHDLLQPLNAARLYVGALREQGDDDLIDRIESALEAQDDLLASLLDISRLEAGVLAPRIGPVPMAPVLHDLARQFGILASARGLALRVVASGACVDTDVLLLRRVLQNFLSNAIHYTPRGRVLLGCRRLATHLRIEVWDSGIGIPEGQRAAIFEEFRRLDSGVNRDQRGAGLGLSIVDRIARLLDHPISLRSWPGRGSVFSIEVPLATTLAPTPAATPAEEASPLAGVRVLCIDDERAARDATGALLRSWGCLVTSAGDAREAMRLADTDDAPQLVILDYQLGATLGPDLLPALRLRWGSAPPTILVSARNDADVRQRAVADGLRYLAKPIAPARLRAILSHLLLTASPGVFPAPSGAGHPARPHPGCD
jgi:histidine kinase